MIRAHDTHGFAIAMSQQFCKFIFQFHINYKEENLVSCRSTDNLFFLKWRWYTGIKRMHTSLFIYYPT
jgi:hypothetical protein